mmetsp:Transcript_32086/g.78168  ORF Transcript_32086/g.78168 Transcript_32086/m.78168 type:complete len:119 (+) Transcript_32086:81-437(+)
MTRPVPWPSFHCIPQKLYKIVGLMKKTNLFNRQPRLLILQYSTVELRLKVRFLLGASVWFVIPSKLPTIAHVETEGRSRVDVLYKFVWVRQAISGRFSHFLQFIYDWNLTKGIQSSIV